MKKTLLLLLFIPLFLGCNKEEDEQRTIADDIIGEWVIIIPEGSDILSASYSFENNNAWRQTASVKLQDKTESYDRLSFAVGRYSVDVSLSFLYLTLDSLCVIDRNDTIIVSRIDNFLSYKISIYNDTLLLSSPGSTSDSTKEYKEYYIRKVAL